jgi:hypothetical protein
LEPLPVSASKWGLLGADPVLIHSVSSPMLSLRSETSLRPLCSLTATSKDEEHNEYLLNYLRSISCP